MIDMTVQNRTGLSPEWDHWFDEQFADLIAADEELVRAEFDDLMSSTWPPSPSHPSPPAPPDGDSPTPTPTSNTAEPLPPPDAPEQRRAQAPPDS